MRLLAAAPFCIVLLGCSSGPFSGFRESFRISPEENAQIQKILRENEGAIRNCYLNQFEKAEVRPAGSIQMSFVIDQDGKATEAKIRETTLHEPKVERCFVKAISAIQFPTPKTGTGIFYSFNYDFNPQK
jgi:hypothetical protein